MQGEISFWGRSSLGRGEVILARFARKGKSASRLAISWLRQPSFRPKVSQLANGTYRLIISREILPTHSSSKDEQNAP